MPLIKRCGKRKKAQEPCCVHQMVGLHRTWSGLATFTVMITIVLPAGAGTTNGRVLGADAVGVSMYKPTGLLMHLNPWRVNVRQEPSRTRTPPKAEHPPTAPGVSRALVGVETFSFDGKAAVTAHENYDKDKEGGWIWGNCSRMSK